MPPWRTVDDTRADGRPVSLTTMASASSAALRCCTSKSGGTYSASITGVSGSTLTNRIVPSDGRRHHQGGGDRGLGQVRIREVDRNQDLLVHGTVPSDLVSEPYCHACGQTVSAEAPVVPAAMTQTDLASSHIGANWAGPFARRVSFLAPLGRAPRWHRQTRSAAASERGLTKRSSRPPWGCSLRQVLAGKIDHREAGGRQSFIEPLARLDVARGDQQPRQLVQPRIVADHEQRAHRRRGLLAPARGSPRRRRCRGDPRRLTRGRAASAAARVPRSPACAAAVDTTTRSGMSA